MTPPVRCLPPGHYLTARPGGPVESFRYWRPVLRPAKSPAPETPERILAALRDSVLAHLRSDVPLGAFLSGGVDSAAICAIAAQARPGMATFTAGFARSGYSEIEEAQETAQALGLRANTYVITPDEFAARLPQIIWHLDDPMADAAAIPLWFVAREARRQVKVVLSGEGADELFGGYGVYYQPGVVRAATKLPGWGRSSAQAMADRIRAGQKGKGLLERIATPLRSRYIGNANVFAPEDVDVLTRYGGGTAYDVTEPIFDQAAESGLDDVATMQLIDINTWLPGDILVKADRASMAHGLELRSPFLDREVMAVASRLRGRRRRPRPRPSSRCGRRSPRCCRRRRPSAASSGSRCRSGTGSAASSPATRTRWSARRGPRSGWTSGPSSTCSAGSGRATPRRRGARSGRWSCSRSGTRSTWSGYSTRSPSAGRDQGPGQGRPGQPRGIAPRADFAAAAQR